MNNSVGTSVGSPYCHRCGKPVTGGRYLEGAPTCAWCLAELSSVQSGSYSFRTYTTSPINNSYFQVDEDSQILFIKVKYLVEDLEPLEYIGQGVSDWVDLRAAKEMVISKGQHVLIPLGVAIELPKGYEAIVAPRSSTFKKWGLLQTNSIGIIDEAYCGDGDQWLWTVYATRDAIINKNDRICQFRIIKHQPQLIFKTVETLGNEDRSGFGSTGVK